MINEALFSSKSDEWTTPQDIFQRLNEEFNFNLDPCANSQNHKCDTFYTLENDGLSHSWGGTEYFAIRHIVKLINGLKRHIGRAGKIIRLSFYLFQQGQTRDIFTILFIEEQKSVLLGVG